MVMLLFAKVLYSLAFCKCLQKNAERSSREPSPSLHKPKQYVLHCVPVLDINIQNMLIYGSTSLLSGISLLASFSSGSRLKRNIPLQNLKKKKMRRKHNYILKVLTSSFVFDRSQSQLVPMIPLGLKETKDIDFKEPFKASGMLQFVA